MKKLLLILQLIAGAAIMSASAYLAVTSPGRQVEPLRIAAAAVAALPGAWAVGRSIYEYFRSDADDESIRRRVRQSLYTGLLTLHRDKIYRGDITEVSFHVWVLPGWYCRVRGPWTKVRKVLKPETFQVPQGMKPPLLRLASARLDQREQSSGLTFRKGVGLIGRCVERNMGDRALIARFNSDEFEQAISSRRAWFAASPEVHHGLARHEARRLAESYTQAAALVIRNEKAEPIGCVTLDLPRSSDSRFRRSADHANDPLIGVLKATAEQVSNNLRT